jgi:serine-threonine kinase receptor-associated protein
VYVHDYETGEELLCNKGHHGPVYGVRFTPDARAYASAGDDGTIRIWTFAEADGTDAAAAGEGEGEAQTAGGEAKAVDVADAA